MHTQNLIHGQKPEFGNIAHINYVRLMERHMSGEINFHEITWQPGQYIGGGDKSKPRFKFCSPKNADCLVDYIPCPRCKRQHILLVCIDPDSVPYDQNVAADEESEEFECWSCGLEFETQQRLVYVKQPVV